MVIDMPVDDTLNVPCRSLKEVAWREANDWRWFLSEQEKRDVGESAIRMWVHQHWPGFLRARWIDHMLGVEFWAELDRNEFGILRKTPPSLRPLLDELIGHLICGAENLNIICWSRRKPPSEQATIRELLHLINVNGHRLRCHFADEPPCLTANAPTSQLA
jgi:hypothetical protein